MEDTGISDSIGRTGIRYGSDGGVVSSERCRVVAIHPGSLRRVEEGDVLRLRGRCDALGQIHVEALGGDGAPVGEIAAPAPRSLWHASPATHSARMERIDGDSLDVRISQAG